MRHHFPHLSLGQHVPRIQSRQDAKTLSAISITIADLHLELMVPAKAARAVRQAYPGFTRPRASAVPSDLQLFATGSNWMRRIGVAPTVRLEVLDSTRIALEGACSGILDLGRRRGTIQGHYPFLAMDTLVRLALSLLAPRRRWLLMHGAAVLTQSGSWVLVLGRQRAGKSTAARALRSFCDELVLVRCAPEVAEAASTPYWRGVPGSGECGALVCLDRGGEPKVRRLRGTAAVRALAPHVVRHVPMDWTEPDSISRLCSAATRIPVYEFHCPEGPAYIPFLVDALEKLGHAPIRRGRAVAT